MKLQGTSTRDRITLKWKEYPGAEKYAVYGSKCSKNSRMKEIRSVSGSRFTIHVEDGIHYKYCVRALDSSGSEIARAKTVHVARKGQESGNPEDIKVSDKTIKLKIGKTAKINGRIVPGTLPVSVHREIEYESSNPRIAKVDRKAGMITSKKKGTCYIYVYAQNGLYKKAKVKVSRRSIFADMADTKACRKQK